MDDSDTAFWVGVVALGMILASVAALVWLLGPLNPSGLGQDRAPLSDQPLSDARPPHRPLDRIHHCIDAAVTRSMSPCAAPAGPSVPPASSDHRGQRSAHPGRSVKSDSTHATAPAAPASEPPTS